VNTPFQPASEKSSKGTVSFVAGGSVFGSGFRIRADAVTYLVTAFHVWSDAQGKLAAGDEVCLAARDGVSVPLVGNLKAFSYARHFDFALVELEPKMWASLGVSALTPVCKEKSPHIKVSGANAGSWVESWGFTTPMSRLFRVNHTASTVGGFSGSPLVSAEGHALGIHIGHENGKNEATTMHPVMRAVKTLSGLESDFVSKHWRYVDELSDVDGKDVVYFQGAKNVYDSHNNQWNEERFDAEWEATRFFHSWADEVEEDEMSDTEYFAYRARMRDLGAESGETPLPPKIPPPPPKKSKSATKRQKRKAKQAKAAEKGKTRELESGEQDFPGTLSLEQQRPYLVSQRLICGEHLVCNDCCHWVDINSSTMEILSPGCGESVGVRIEHRPEEAVSPPLLRQPISFLNRQVGVGRRLLGTGSVIPSSSIRVRDPRLANSAPQMPRADGESKGVRGRQNRQLRLQASATRIVELEAEVRRLRDALERAQEKSSSDAAQDL
jgi:hypothetical protein